MNYEERIAKRYLDTLPFKRVIFEPDGNFPPDFSLDAHIGVEVRRLNENYFGQGKSEGLEQVEIPLRKAISEVLSTFQGTNSTNSYWIWFVYGRPLKMSGKQLRRDIKHALASFLSSGSAAPTMLTVCPGLEISIHPSSTHRGRPFTVGGSSDDDSGGAVVQLYVDNIAHCIDEKSRKIAPFLSAYSEWWLLLVDSLNLDLLPAEWQEVKGAIKGFRNFQKVILIDQAGSPKLF